MENPITDIPCCAVVIAKIRIISGEHGLRNYYIVITYTDRQCEAASTAWSLPL
jgi:hypothetical protein